MQLLLPTCCPRTVDAAPPWLGMFTMAARRRHSYPNAGRMGSLSTQLGFAIGVESCCCQKKCLGDSAKNVEYWFWQQKGVIISCVREVLIAVYTLPGHGHS